ncbi:hypothetical protein BDZ89DRAFT_1071515 [Hymenopellis radicata]|nr:hypothetical protein BDZ89DRAFT_1071515 [Hymenopellis radicata]
MQFKFFTLFAALASLAVAVPSADAADGLDKRGCVFVPVSEGCASDWVSCGLNGPGNAVKCCEIVCA